MLFKSILTAAALALTHVGSVIGASANTTLTCSSLQTKYPAQLAYQFNGFNLPEDLEFSYAQTHYWSAANGDNKPACVFFPENAQMVSYFVTLLNKYPDVQWAMKSGGHNPNVGYSSTNGGVLMSFSSLASTTLDAKGLAHVGPGARWGDALTALEPHGVAIVGGRVGDVGVGGYTLGGGLSFLSTEYGLACDNIVNYQVVTATGDIINVNNTTNTDLFFALKGGGNQFGIVTEFTMKTHQIGQVWGGTKIFDATKKDELINATHALISDYHDPKAAVIVTSTQSLESLVDIFVVFFFYNSPSGPGPILNQFNAIDAIESNVKIQSYADLLVANNEYNIYGLRYNIRSGTLPNLPGAAGIDLYNYQYTSFKSLARQYQAEQADVLVFSFAFQPLPYSVAALSSAQGGNALGLDPANGDRVWMEYDVSWLLPQSDAHAAVYLTNITQPVLDYAKTKYNGVKTTHYQHGDVQQLSYNPLFMNDGMYNQKILQSYGTDSFNKLQQIQIRRDPLGLFARRQGGFKFQ